MKLLREERGQTLVLTAMCMTMMLAFMALALDVGVLFRAKRRMQIAADAAAMAGTTELFYNGTTNVAAKAYAAAKANGVDNTVSGNTVTVTLPPISLGATACATCVEVQLSTPNPTVFMGIILLASRIYYHGGGWIEAGRVKTAALGGYFGSFWLGFSSVDGMGGEVNGYCLLLASRITVAAQAITPDLHGESLAY